MRWGARKPTGASSSTSSQRVGIPLYGVSDHNLDDVLKSIRDLGKLLDAQKEAEALDSSLELRLRAVAERVKDHPKPRVLFVTWYQPLIHDWSPKSCS